MSLCSRYSLVGVPDGANICIYLTVPRDVGVGELPPGRDKKGLLAVRFAV